MTTATIDATDVKRNLDCRYVIEQDLGQPRQKFAGSWVFDCPFHQEKSEGGFHVFKDGYKCFSCGSYGDAIQWRIEYHKENFQHALAVLSGQPLDDIVTITPQERARLAEERARKVEQDLQERIHEAQATLEELRAARKWLAYHEQLNEQARELWHKRGIPDLYLDYWKLGYDSQHVIWTRQGEWTTPTLTIPLFEASTWECQNIKHRLLNPFKPNDKYRYDRSGLPAAWFVAEPDMPLEGKTMLVEGEIKGMNAFIAADDPKLQVVGSPSKNPSNELLEMLDKCEPVYICLDPDATVEAHAVADTLRRERCLMVELPEKIDDYLLARVPQEERKGFMRKVLDQAVRA